MRVSNLKLWTDDGSIDQPDDQSIDQFIDQSDDHQRPKAKHPTE
jgi:hypothetical protein